MLTPSLIISEYYNLMRRLCSVVIADDKIKVKVHLHVVDQDKNKVKQWS